MNYHIDIPVSEELEKTAKKIAFTGTHGVGKTTAVFYYITQLKLRYSDKRIINLNENAAHSPLPINKTTTVESQQWIFCDQLSKEIALTSKYDLLICDRTICDSIAYSRATGKATGRNDLTEFADYQYQFAKTFIRSYDAIIFKTIEHNNHWHEDGVRDAKDLQYRMMVQEELKKVYDDLIIDGIPLPITYV